jgi:GT2 family glycosyltransferase
MTPDSNFPIQPKPVQPKPAAKKLSVIVVSWNVVGLLRRCLETLNNELTGIDAEVFVVDNNSADKSTDMTAMEFPQFYLIPNKSNLGFAVANNQALALSCGEYVLLLNPDTEVIPGAIKHLVDFLDNHSDAGIVAPQLINSDGSIQRSCREFPTFAGMLYELLGLSKMFPNHPLFGRYKMLDFDHGSQREVDQPEGACLLMRRSVIDEVGPLDEGFFMLFEEVDWCYRIKKANWKIWFSPQAKVVHHYGQSIKQVKAKMILSSHRGLHRYWKKHLSKGCEFLDAPVYLGLMILAYVRIVSHTVRAALVGTHTTPGRIEAKTPAPAEDPARVAQETVSQGRR